MYNVINKMIPKIAKKHEKAKNRMKKLKAVKNCMKSHEKAKEWSKCTRGTFIDIGM